MKEILTNKKVKAKQLLLLAVLLLGYSISQKYYFRIDLTKDSRYSLSENTLKLLKSLKDKYTAEMFLSGDLPYGFHKLKKATEEIITEFERNSNTEIYYLQMNPNLQEKGVVEQLIKRGLQYTNINIRGKKGKITQQLLFPSLILHNGKKEITIDLLENNPKLSGQENLNNSIANLEYKLSNALRVLTREYKPKVAFLQGQDELDKTQTLDFARTLSENYDILQIKATQIDSTLSTLIIANPRKDFDEKDKFLIDQYIMKGGKTLWLIDEVEVSKDSLRQHQSAMAYYKPLNLEDQLFSYGVRINPDLVMDINSDLIKVNTALKGNPPKFNPMPWAYEPLLETNPENPITKNIAPVRAIFANSIDPLNVEEIQTTILLRTSQSSKLRKVPTVITMTEIQNMQEPSFYNKANIPIAVLQEGVFPSVFAGRLLFNNKKDFKQKSIPNKMIIISDGDIIKNEIKGKGNNMQFLPLGYNPDYKYTHGNKTFLINSIDYLCDNDGWTELRNKKYIPTLLSKSKIRNERNFWQWLNLVAPVLLLLISGFIYSIYRNKKYKKNRR